MKNIKRLIQISIASIVLALGCGSPVDDNVFLGENEQALSSRFAPNFTMGLNENSPAHFGCHGVAGEVCINLPVQKNFKWCDDTLTHADTLSAFATAVTGVQQASNNNFTFQYMGHCPVPFNSNFADVLINEAPCPGALSSNIEGYACGNWGQQPVANNLSETLPGLYYAATTHTTGICHIDRADILAKGANATEDSKLLLHSSYKCAWEVIGIGLHSEATNAMTGRAIAPINQNRPIGTPGDQCRASSYSIVSPLTYGGAGAPCPFN